MGIAKRRRLSRQLRARAERRCGRWLCAAIVPLVWQRLPDLDFHARGRGPDAAVRALARRTFESPASLPTLGRCSRGRASLPRRCVSAPGTKGKIVYAFAHGIPVVSTTVGAEGIFAAAEYHAIRRTTPEPSPRSIVESSRRPRALGTAVGAGRAIAARFTPAAARQKLDALLAASRVRR